MFVAIDISIADSENVINGKPKNTTLSEQFK